MNTLVKTFDVCLYHNNCPDGIGAAYPFWRINKFINREDFIILGVNHGESIPDIVQNKNVVIVDFSYKKDQIIELCSIAKKVLILDHHKTAEENLSNLDNLDNYDYIFDMNRSGAQIAWDYCYPKINRPWFIDIIADRDLWKWELPFSKEIGNALFAGGWYQFDKLEELYMNPSSIEQIKYIFKEQGKLLMKAEQKQIDIAVHNATKCIFEGYTVLLTTCDPTLRSDVGNILSEQDDVDFSATWRYSFENDEWWISLRGSKKCIIPLHKIAEKYLGGGHPKACGFKLTGNLHDYFKIIVDE